MQWGGIELYPSLLPHYAATLDCLPLVAFLGCVPLKSALLTPIHFQLSVPPRIVVRPVYPPLFSTIPRLFMYHFAWLKDR